MGTKPRTEDAPPVDPPADPPTDPPADPPADMPDDNPPAPPAAPPADPPAPKPAAKPADGGVDMEAIADLVVEKLRAGTGTVTSGAQDVNAAVAAALAEREHQEQHERMASGKREHRGLFKSFFPNL